VRGAAPANVSARLRSNVTLETQAEGEIAVCFEGYSVGLGRFSAGAAHRAQNLRIGLPLAAFASNRRNIDKEIDLLVRRLARRGLLEYRLGGSGIGEDQVVIETQMPDYWPRTPQLGNADAVVLSRFAYMRRRGNEMILESPRAGALFKICNPKIAAVLAMLSTPQHIKQLRRQDDFPGLELLALLLDCQILFKVDAAGGSGLRPAEGDHNLVLWDFHDLLFHTRSTEGRHEIRLRLHQVQADQAALQRRQEEFERHALAAPSTTWAEAAAEARYLILLFAETSEARNPRRQELIAKVLDDLARLSD